jgi:NAD(P) transhydrogenase
MVPANRLAKPYELVIIGGGPAGVSAAMQAALTSRRCIIVDKPKVPPDESGLDISFGGPTGLWSKALRDTAKTVDVRTLRSMGISDSNIWSQIRDSCINLATQNAKYQTKRLELYKVDYLQATADLTTKGEVFCTLLDGTVTRLHTDNVLIATGSRPRRVPSVPFDDERVFDSDTINQLGFLPKNVCISGSGIIAIEYAKIFQNLGAQVTILVRSNILSALERTGIDSDVSSGLIDYLGGDGVTMIEGVEPVTFDIPPKRTEPMTIFLKSCTGSCRSSIPTNKNFEQTECPVSVTCDVFLAANGRVANTGFLDKLGCEVAKDGSIIVDGNFQSSVPGLYACGDTVGRPALASTGEFQGRLVVERIFDEKKRATKLPQFPVGVWTLPEVSYFGLTKKGAQEQGIEVEEGITAYSGCLRGRVFAPEGMLKLVFRKDNGVILGVHILGHDACEMVHYGMALVKEESTIFELMTTIFTAVTFHDLFKEAAFDGNSKLQFGLEWHAVFEDMLLAGDGDGSGFLDEEESKAMFNKIDTDGSGELDAEELGAFFDNLGHSVQPGTLANLIRMCDDDDSGTIGWTEFERILHELRNLEERRQKERSVDTDRSLLDGII